MGLFYPFLYKLNNDYVFFDKKYYRKRKEITVNWCDFISNFIFLIFFKDIKVIEFFI